MHVVAVAQDIAWMLAAGAALAEPATPNSPNAIIRKTDTEAVTRRNVLPPRAFSPMGD
jgi:hypothetical protein